MSTEDTLNFWKGIADVGLLGEVVTNISTELLELLNGVQQRREPAALQDTGTLQRYCALAAGNSDYQNRIHARLRASSKTHDRETNGKKEQIQLLFEAD